MNTIQKIKLYQIKTIKQCKFKAYLSQLDFKTLNNKSSMIRTLYNDILKNYDFVKFTKEELNKLILDKMGDEYFLTKQEKEIEVLTILNYLLRYIKYEQKLNRNILAKEVKGYVQIGDTEIEVKADAVFENADNIEIVKYKTGATELSYKARTDKNLPENDIELFLLKRLGEQLYPDKTIISSFYHLKGKNEDKDVLKQLFLDKSVLEEQINNLKSIATTDKKALKERDKNIKTIADVFYYNNSEGNNIITFNYDKDLSNEILELTNTELDFNSEKCISGDCDFCSYSTLCQYKVKTTTLDEVKNVAKASGEVKLTNEQQQVIVIEEGNWRINSVAGSGKTTVMSLRAIELFKKGYKPSDILLITFTNKGCGELKEKIAYWLKYCKIKSINKKSLNIFTFNGFGESIVSKQWKKLGFKQKPELATMVDVNDIIKELLQEYDKIEWLNYKNPLLNYPNAKGAFKQLTIYFDLIKSFNYNVNTLCDGVIVREKTSSGLTIANMMDKSTLIFEMYNKFNAKLKAKSLMQYQDQILYLIELLEKYPQLINTYGFKHVIVDEYQDTDFTQVKLMHLLTQYKGFKSLMVVGDSSQSVYGFRLTTPKNIIDFHKEFDNVKDIFLLDNFRSTPQICSTANKLDKLNTERIDKEIIGRKVDGKLPQLLEFNALEDEYKNITDLIEDKIKVGVPLHEICFIARTKKELLEIQDYLNKKNIPSIIEASERFLDNSNVQCIINLANFFKNNDYDYYLAEYLYIINNDFKTMDMNDIKKTVADFKISILEGFNLLEDETQKIEYFNTLISPILDIDTIAKDFMEYLNQTTFGAFNEMLVHLQKITLYEDDTSIEKSDSKYQAVCLTTGHSSKGKEWSIVINSIDNFKYETDDLQALEEERRLLFVSITRAKDELYVTYNTNQDKSRNKGKYCLFADELEDIEKIKI